MVDNNNIVNNESLFDYKLHITVFIIFSLSQYIGIIKFTVFKSITIIILPLIFSLFLSIICYISKKVSWIDNKQSNISTVLMVLFIGPLIAKLAIISGQNISMLYQLGPLILLEELGDLGPIILALPVALLLGFKKEAIGMTSSICREPQMAVIIEKYGFTSPETKGFMSVYLIGIVLGTVMISIIANLLAYIIPLHPYAYAIACGIGSTSMNVAGVSSLVIIYPELSNQLIAFSGISNLISIILSIYVYIFISLPLTEKLYNILEPKLSKFKIK